MANNHSADTIQLPAVSGATVLDIDGKKYVVAVFSDLETLDVMKDSVFTLIQSASATQQSYDLTPCESVYYAIELVKSLTPKTEAL